MLGKLSTSLTQLALLLPVWLWNALRLVILYCLAKAFKVELVGCLERMHIFNIKAWSKECVQITGVPSTPFHNESLSITLVEVSFRLNQGCLEVFLELLIFIDHFETPLLGHLCVILSTNNWGFNLLSQNFHLTIHIVDIGINMFDLFSLSG